MEANKAVRRRRAGGKGEGPGGVTSAERHGSETPRGPKPARHLALRVRKARISTCSTMGTTTTTLGTPRRPNSLARARRSGRTFRRPTGRPSRQHLGDCRVPYPGQEGSEVRVPFRWQLRAGDP